MGKMRPERWRQAFCRGPRPCGVHTYRARPPLPLSTLPAPAQRAILRALRAFRSETTDLRLRDQCDRMEDAFSRYIVRPAIRREMVRLRRDDVQGQALLREMGRIHTLYRMDLDVGNAVQEEAEARDNLPRIVCSEAGLT